jgi:two-component system chemotaxis response regulator CheB
VPLKKLVAQLPHDFPAAVFVIVHIPSWRRSDLPKILTLCGRLPAKHPDSGELVRPGQIYVAPPDHHLLLDDSRVLLWRGPKENRHRPAINASFRSAATTYRDRTVGVILSGILDDGATGLWWIKHFGGIAIVQDPDDTQFPDMPSAALEHVEVDYVAPAHQIGTLIVDLTRNGRVRERNTQPEERT